MNIFAHGDWSGYFMIGMLIFVALVVASLLLYAGFYSVDYFFGKTLKTPCVVEDIFKTAEHLEFSPNVRVVPDHWQLDIRTPYGVDDFRFAEEPGPEFQRGCSVLAVYRVGGITKTAIVIHSISSIGRPV